MAFPLIGGVFTLTEYLKGDDISDQERPYIQMFAESSDVMSVIPFMGFTGPVWQGYRTSGLPQSLGFRAINGAPTSGAGTLTPFQEASYIIDHDIPIDTAIVRRSPGGRRRSIEDQNGMARMGELWVTTFLKGDNTVTPTAFNGLQKRASMDGRQIYDNSLGTSGGTPLSLLQLDKMLWNTRSPTHIIAPWTMMPLFTQVARNQSLTGYVMQTWDEIGKPKLSYAGLPILFGYPKDLHPPILPFTEVAPAGGGAVTSSIYAVSFGEDGVFGIQLKPMEVIDQGLLQDRVTENTHVSWDVGLVVAHQFSFARLAGITNAAIVA